jgi:HPt (histidine-containing phosphotransfer) domain-containing protein
MQVSEPIIDETDLRRLLDVIGGDPEDFAELIEEFEESTPKTFRTMEAAAAAGDLDALRIGSHSLKSNGRDFGAKALASACERLEHDCKSGSVTEPEARVSAIGEELQRARIALAGITITDG